MAPRISTIRRLLNCRSLARTFELVCIPSSCACVDKTARFNAAEIWPSKTRGPCSLGFSNHIPSNELWHWYIRTGRRFTALRSIECSFVACATPARLYCYASMHMIYPTSPHPLSCTSSALVSDMRDPGPHGKLRFRSVPPRPVCD